MPPPTTDLLSTKETAQLLGVSIRTVHRMADDGRLEPAVRLAGTRGPLIFARSAVEKFAAAKAS